MLAHMYVCVSMPCPFINVCKGKYIPTERQINPRIKKNKNKKTDIHISNQII